MATKDVPRKIRIALDAMGGDHAPEQIIRGAIAAAEDNELEVVLVGQENVIREELRRCGSPNSNICIVNADQVVAMDERPVAAIKEKTDSSISVGINLLHEGRVESFVSAGNTGAVMIAACLTVGRMRDLDRPALGAVFPFPRGPILCLDLGANPDCKPSSLVQFAQMGSIYMQRIFNIDSPRVGLLSTGHEDTKGNQLVLETFGLLKETDINFIGNVEGGDIASGRADVIVTDGFTGNVLLKLGEGLGEMLLESLKHAIDQDEKLKEAAAVLWPTFHDVIGTLDYRAYGGALMFGVNGNVIVAHGRSDADAVRGAVSAAKKTVQQEVVEHLKG